MLTGILMFVVMAVATDTRAVGAAAAIAIGGTIGLDVLVGALAYQLVRGESGERPEQRLDTAAGTA